MRLRSASTIGIAAQLIHTVAFHQAASISAVGALTRPVARNLPRTFVCAGLLSTVRQKSRSSRRSDAMVTIKGDVFRFETIGIQKEGSDPPEYRSFCVPVPVETELKLPEEGAEGQSGDAAAAEGAAFPGLTIQQNAVTVREPFKAYIQRNIPQLEARLDVRISLKPQGHSLVLLASGARSAEALAEMVNLCRTSRVYNYYLCFPVRGSEFNEQFSDFKQRVKKCLGGNVAYEKRPHVTLALLNLVTDDDVDAVVKCLQGTTLAVSSLSLDAEGKRRPYSLALSGVNSIKYKGKAARRSVFMTHATPDDTLCDIASEFQDSVKRTVNQLIAATRRRISALKDVKPPERKEIGAMTEEEAAALGIYFAPGGSLEVTYTDVALMDPDGSIGDDELNALLEKVRAKNRTYMSGAALKPTVKPGPGFRTSSEPKGAKSTKAPSQPNRTTAAGQKPNAVAGKTPPERRAESDDEADEELPDYETSVTHDLHVTLLRNEKVDQLKHLPFSGRGEVACVELRPRGRETCSYNAYARGQLVRFVGSRFDGKRVEQQGACQVAGSTSADVPAELTTDEGTLESEGCRERFVFWI